MSVSFFVSIHEAALKRKESGGAPPAPFLVVAPLSTLGNWEREASPNPSPLGLCGAHS